MNIQLLNKNISDIKADILVEFLTPDALKEHAEAKILNQAGFKAEQDSICFFHDRGLLFCGTDSKNSDDIRSAASSMIKALKSSNYESAAFSVFKNSSLCAMVEGVVLGGYEFNEYKSEPKKIALKNISLASDELDYEELKTTFDEALIVANATCYTRDIVNKAPQELNPETFAILAKKLADANSLECNILAEDELKSQKMNAMLAVGRASIHQSQLIHLAYKPANPKKIISLVGKGLTYDSGGLSLKPATSMVTMKMDKAGACAVLGMIKAASELKLNVEIHVFIGAVENMIGGNAYKPDDVLVSRSGTTIEVRNTDAEGRLVLADVLSYAQDTVKAIYSRSHRNSSWQEMFTMNNRARVGNTDLDPEKVDAFELAYIKKLTSDSYLQTNVFYLMNKDQIYNTAADAEYRNVVDTNIYGFELEYKGNLSSSDQLYLNYTYLDGTSYIKDENKSEPIPNVANHLAKGYYIYSLTSSLSLSGIAKYVGSKKRVSGDTRNTLDAYSTLDTSLNYKDKKYNYTIVLSLKNIFDATVKYSSPPKTYSQDYEQEGQNFLISLTKKF